MINLLYHDNDIAVCVKPAGVLSEGETAGSMPYLLTLAMKERGRDVTPYVVHRLDKETEGLTVYAFNSESAAALSASIQNGDFEKIYHATCVGAIEKDSDTLCDLLFYDRKRGKSFVVDRKRGGVKSASLEYTVLERFPDKTALRIKLGTGRTHQIRVQLASRGHPLCGDRRYGAPASFGNALALCAVKLSFPHPRTRKRMEFSLG